MAIYEYKGFVPVVHPTAFIHPLAAVTGDVTLGRDVYIGPGAAIRGDFGTIIIEDGGNVQENCTVHMFPGLTAKLCRNAHVGHGAVVLIGMNAVIMDNVEIGDGSIVGALTFVPADMKIPARKIVVGNPARIVKEVSDEQFSWKQEGTLLYQQLARSLGTEWHPCEPLREIPLDREHARSARAVTYAPWKRSE